jgi:gamma-glutamylcyclotransferase (GGCT)/AIG2-like uncharacterized protein YtfP
MLFVYGTLRSEFDNQYARLLREQADLVGHTTVPGSIFRVGNFPAWKPEPAGEVHGELYRLRNPDTILKALDEYEGPDFERVVVRAARPESLSVVGSGSAASPRVRSATPLQVVQSRTYRPGGAEEDAWIYQYKKVPPKYSRIASGDFCAERTEEEKGRGW